MILKSAKNMQDFLPGQLSQLNSPILFQFSQKVNICNSYA